MQEPSSLMFRNPTHIENKKGYVLSNVIIMSSLLFLKRPRAGINFSIYVNIGEVINAYKHVYIYIYIYIYIYTVSTHSTTVVY